MEGIMMRHKDQYAIAVRKPNQEVELKTEEYKSFIKNKKLMSFPIIRGMFNFVDSLVVGTKCLMYSATFFEEDEAESQKEKMTEAELKNYEAKQEKENKILIAVTVCCSILLSVGIFMLLPYFIASLLNKIGASNTIVVIAEAVVRLLLFFTYIFLISRMKDIQRFFMYHGAEHKCINCIEHGQELTVDNVMKSSRLHRRCGTSFLLIVMVVSAVFFLFIHVSSPWMRVIVRLLLVPVIAGVSYEFIKLAGRSENQVVLFLSKPGMLLQKMTTKEPEPEMVEVAITAVEAVFDWKEYLRENFRDATEKELVL